MLEYQQQVTNKLFYMILGSILLIIAVSLAQFDDLFLFGSEQISPFNRIKHSDIYLTKESLTIISHNFTLAQFAGTNSMDPLFDEDSIGIEIKPISEAEIKIGDIVAYNYKGQTIIHRVIARDEDDKGTYFILKGDNNIFKDTQKVRFNQIQAILVGVLY